MALGAVALAPAAVFQTARGAPSEPRTAVAAPPAQTTLRGAPSGGAEAKQRLRARTPAPGSLLRVSGFVGLQHLWCRGPQPKAGVPTIAVISGAADYSLSWRKVQSRLSREHRVCTYDRASLGWSGRSHAPRTGRHIVRELHRLLHAAGIDGPLVVVGHSMGGVYTRMFTARYPKRVVGVALVDAGDEHLPTAISRAARDELGANVRLAAKSQRAGAKTCATGAYARKPRLIPLATVLPRPDALTDRRLQAAWCRTWRGAADEGLGVFRTWAQARALDLGKGSLGRRPVAIVVSDSPLTFVPDPALNRQVVDRWRELQREQRDLSSRSRFRVARDSGHMVMLDRPDTVVAATRWVLDRLG